MAELLLVAGYQPVRHPHLRVWEPFSTARRVSQWDFCPLTDEPPDYVGGDLARRDGGNRWVTEVTEVGCVLVSAAAACSDWLLGRDPPPQVEGGGRSGRAALAM